MEWNPDPCRWRSLRPCPGVAASRKFVQRFQRRSARGGHFSGRGIAPDQDCMGLRGTCLCARLEDSARDWLTKSLTTKDTKYHEGIHQQNFWPLTEVADRFPSWYFVSLACPERSRRVVDAFRISRMGIMPFFVIYTLVRRLVLSAEAANGHTFVIFSFLPNTAASQPCCDYSGNETTFRTGSWAS